MYSDIECWDSGIPNCSTLYFKDLSKQNNLQSMGNPHGNYQLQYKLSRIALSHNTSSSTSMPFCKNSNNMQAKHGVFLQTTPWQGWKPDGTLGHKKNVANIYIDIYIWFHFIESTSATHRLESHRNLRQKRCHHSHKHFVKCSMKRKM